MMRRVPRAQNQAAFRRDFPQYFRDTQAAAPLYRQLAASGFMAVLPQQAPGGHRVVTSAPALLPAELARSDPDGVCSYGLWLMERLMHDPHVQARTQPAVVQHCSCRRLCTVARVRSHPAFAPSTDHLQLCLMRRCTAWRAW